MFVVKVQEGTGGDRGWIVGRVRGVWGKGERERWEECEGERAAV